MLVNYSTAILDIYQSIYGLRNQLVCSHIPVFIYCLTESFPIKDFRLLVLGGCKTLIIPGSSGLISQSRFMPIWSPHSRIWVTSIGRSSKSTSPLSQRPYPTHNIYQSFLRAVRAVRSSQCNNRQGSRTMFPSFAGTTSKSTTSRMAVNIELERVTHKDAGFEVDSYVQADKSVTELVRNGVHVVMAPMADAARDTLRRAELRLEEEAMVQDFHRQL